MSFYKKPVQHRSIIQTVDKNLRLTNSSMVLQNDTRANVKRIFVKTQSELAVATATGNWQPTRLEFKACLFD